MDPFIIKRGDTAPSLQATLSDEGGGPDLDGATIRFKMRLLNEDETLGETVVDSAGEVVSVEDFTVRYNWAEGDLDIEDGDYVAEFKVVKDGRTMTYPDKGYMYVTITEAL